MRRIGRIRPVGLQPRNLVGVTLQPLAHVSRQTVGIDTAAIAVTENGRSLVVVAHYDKAAVIADVEDIQSAHLACRHNGIAQRRRTSGMLTRHELLGPFQSLLLGNFLCPQKRQAAN